MLVNKPCAKGEQKTNYKIKTGKLGPTNTTLI